MAKSEQPAMVRLRHPDARACSWNGDIYNADAEGVVTVPAAAAEPLAAHGFTAADAAKE